MSIASVTLVLFLESSNQSFNGRMGVASVIWNQARHDPLKLEQIVTDRNLFPSLPGGRQAQKRELNPEKMNSTDRSVWLVCEHIAARMMDGKFTPWIRANHYHVNDGKLRQWTKGMQVVKVIGDHVFLWEDKV